MIFPSETYHLQKYIYVFELTDNKFFLYSSFQKEDYQIKLEAELYYDYLKKYKIIGIIEKKLQKTPFDIDYYVKQYMYIYGIVNVRGGSYIEENLPDCKSKVLNEEFETVSDDKEKPREYMLQVILEEYKKKQLSKEKIEIEIEEITKKREQYRIEQAKLKNIKHLFIYGFESKIEWLKTQYIQKDINNNSRNEKYRELITQIKKLYLIYLQEFEISNELEEWEIYFKHPEFMFDSYMYLYEHSISMETVYKLCSRLIYLSHRMITRIQEYEFDISSYGYDIEWVFSIKLYLLNLLQNSRTI
uniref:Uncharacterized protein n=1 Tax=viral metagenome TaxID=1070528 RepID=A0A6C0HZL5_9ZZZZ